MTPSEYFLTNIQVFNVYLLLLLTSPGGIDSAFLGYKVYDSQTHEIHSISLF